MVEFIEFHDIIASQARQLIRQTIDPTIKTIQPADAIHIASALWINADEVQTYDEAWANYGEITGLTFAEPHTDNPLLL